MREDYKNFHSRFTLSNNKLWLMFTFKTITYILLLFFFPISAESYWLEINDFDSNTVPVEVFPKENIRGVTETSILIDLCEVISTDKVNYLTIGEYVPPAATDDKHRHQIYFVSNGESVNFPSGIINRIFDILSNSLEDFITDSDFSVFSYLIYGKIISKEKLRKEQKVVSLDFLQTGKWPEIEAGCLIFIKDRTGDLDEAMIYLGNQCFLLYNTELESNKKSFYVQTRHQVNQRKLKHADYHNNLITSHGATFPKMEY